MVRGALAWGAAAAAPATALAYVLRGSRGAASVAIAVGLVLANTALAAGATAIAGRISATAAMFVSLPSFGVRMLGILAALAALKGRSFIDRPAFALAFGVAVTAVIAFEAVRWSRTPWIGLTLNETLTKERA